MGKARELSLQRRVDWMADTIDELREQWTNKQLECELLRKENSRLREELEALEQERMDADPTEGEMARAEEYATACEMAAAGLTPDPGTTGEAGRAG